MFVFYSCAKRLLKLGGFNEGSKGKSNTDRKMWTERNESEAVSSCRIFSGRRSHRSLCGKIHCWWLQYEDSQWLHQCCGLSLLLGWPSVSHRCPWKLDAQLEKHHLPFHVLNPSVLHDHHRLSLYGGQLRSCLSVGLHGDCTRRWDENPGCLWKPEALCTRLPVWCLLVSVLNTVDSRDSALGQDGQAHHRKPSWSSWPCKDLRSHSWGMERVPWWASCRRGAIHALWSRSSSISRCFV